MDEEEYYAEMERRGRMKREAAKAAKAARAASLSLASPAPQPAFQVASVPPAAPAAEKGAPSRRFLCYNALGSIVSASEPGSDFNSVEMAFHDTSRAGRVPTITDYHGYDVGTLGERGCALASPGSKEGGAATLFYRPYESWAHGAEWRASLPAGEKAVSVACGVDWVACVTNRRRLRVFSAHGAQRQCVALDGAPVTLAGSGALLTVAWHAASPSVRDGVVEQRLEYAEYDLTDGGAARVGGGRLPVAPGATLTWLGRCEDGTGALAFGASDGTVSVRTNDFGGSWTPAFSSREAKKRADERHWIVSVAARDADGAAAGVYCVVCRADAPGPNVHPRPVLTPLPLSFPVALPEASSGELEENAAKARLAATLVEAAARNAETTLGADEDGWAAARAGADAAADKAALRLFPRGVQGRAPRAGGGHRRESPPLQLPRRRAEARQRVAPARARAPRHRPHRGEHGRPGRAGAARALRLRAPGAEPARDAGAGGTLPEPGALLARGARGGGEPVREAGGEREQGERATKAGGGKSGRSIRRGEDQGGVRGERDDAGEEEPRREPVRAQVRRRGKASSVARAKTFQQKQRRCVFLFREVRRARREARALAPRPRVLSRALSRSHCSFSASFAAFASAKVLLAPTSAFFAAETLGITLPGLGLSYLLSR